MVKVRVKPRFRLYIIKRFWLRFLTSLRAIYYYIQYYHRRIGIAVGTRALFLRRVSLCCGSLQMHYLIAVNNAELRGKFAVKFLKNRGNFAVKFNKFAAILR